MRKKKMSLLLACFFLLAGAQAFGQIGMSVGFLGGYSGQKPSFPGEEFTTNTTFVYGAKVGIRVMMVGIEGCYFQAAHNLELKELVLLDWDERQVDYNYIGVNLKLYFSFLVVHPYVTVGYGYYTLDISDIDKDGDGGYNVGAGVELMLGKKFALMLEGKYHHVSVDIQHIDLGVGDFTLTGGVLINF